MRESEKVGLMLNIQKTKIMEPDAITSWHIDGETMETVRVFIFLSSKITADGDCSHKIQRLLLLGRNSLVAQNVKLSACNAGDLGSIPGSETSPGEGNGNPLQ